MTNLSVENVYTRQTAKEMTRTHFWKLLGICAITFCIPYALMMLATTLTAPLYDQPFYGLIVFLGMLLITLLSSGLGLGLTRAMIALCRNEEGVTVGSVFRCMHLSLKSFGLVLWVGLKSMLWLIPGYAVMIAGALFAAGMNATATPDEAAAILMLVMLTGLILVFALVIPAAMRYLLSTYILADKPNTGVFECVRRSKAMMKGHKWQAFKLAIPIFLVMYVVMLVFGVALAAATSLLAMTEVAMTLMSVLTLIVMLGISIYYSIRMQLCYVVFYLKRAQAQPSAEATAENPFAV